MLKRISAAIIMRLKVVEVK